MNVSHPLGTGGIMANYQCNAACRHCLYACSPDRRPDYITAETATAVCRLLRQNGCRSLHIGGGEPFLDIDGLCMLIRAVVAGGVRLDYIETNGFWAKDETRAQMYLARIRDAGADTLCISLDPFHAEYVPYGLPLRLAELCDTVGFGYFLWQGRYFSDLRTADPGRVMECSPDLIRKTALSYGLRLGGRALNIPPATAQKRRQGPCTNLLSTDHFHVDCYGNFIPPGCTGLWIPLREAVEGIPSGKYPVWEALVRGGVDELAAFARAQGCADDTDCDFDCARCFYLRKRLSEHGDFAELDNEYYIESLKFYK